MDVIIKQEIIVLRNKYNASSISMDRSPNH